MKLPFVSSQITMNDDPTLQTVSLSIFVAGCVRNCFGCQNEELQLIPDINKWLELEYIFELIRNKKTLIDSVVFTGGDFLPLYENQLKELVKFCKVNSLKTILYTGEEYENIDLWFKNEINIIISGKFDITKYQTIIPASKNQNVHINGILIEHSELEINKRSIT